MAFLVYREREKQNTFAKQTLNFNDKYNYKLSTCLNNQILITKSKPMLWQNEFEILPPVKESTKKHQYLLFIKKILVLL